MAKTEKITVSDTAWTELLSDTDGAAEMDDVAMDMRGVRQIAIDNIGAGRASNGTAVAVVMLVGG